MSHQPPTLGNPREEAARAVAQGRPRSVNPYPQDDPNHALWNWSFDFSTHVRRTSNYRVLPGYDYPVAPPAENSP